MESQTIMDQSIIKAILKHREPFLFIDTVKNICGNQIETSFKISKENIFFKGHFPGEPIMPGVLLIEAIAQSAGFLIIYQLVQEGKYESNMTKYDSYLVKVNSVKFKDKIIPDAVMDIKVRLNPISAGFYEVVGKIFVDQNLKAVGNLLLYLKIIL